jgi:SAM-dependent methyltransferase
MAGPDAMTNGWDESAAAWIADMGTRGDYGREFVLDQPMIGRVKGRGFQRALDVGCGEGRFCRMLKELGVTAIGIDPTKVLVQHANQQDPEGEYRLGIAEALEFADRSFDLVVSYLTLIDIPDVGAAIAENEPGPATAGNAADRQFEQLHYRGAAERVGPRPRRRTPFLYRPLYGGASGVVRLARYPCP